jgi:hypothetical protein
LTLLLGNGDGTFTAGISPTASFSPGAIAVGDFNGDGKADLAVAAVAGNIFTVLLGNGDGTFTAASTKSNAGPNYLIGPIFAGDFNDDGKLDLAVAGEKNNPGTPFTITVALGNGDGTFTAASNYSEINVPSAVGVGDFNGDGRLDVVVLSSPNFTGVVLLGNGDGTFTQSPTGLMVGYPNSVAVGDFNGDGKLDLVIGTGSSLPTIPVLLGNGDGTFTAAASTNLPTGSFPDSVAVGDFNSDGKADLAVFGYQRGTVRVLLGHGDGTFTLTNDLPVSSSPQGALGDFNGDGLPDMAVTTLGSNSVTVMLAQLAQATATVNGISPVGTGTHQVLASYPGDGNYSPSVSSTTGLTALPTTTLTLAANPASTIFGQQMVLTATLSPFTAQGQSTDGELVTFFNGTASVGTGKLTTGVATLNLTSLPAGIRSLHAVYGGDANLAPSTSNAISYRISLAGTLTTFALSNQNLTLTATVAPATSGVPTGTVSFYEGQTLVGTGTLSNGTASYIANSFPTGNVVVSAQYGGDTNFTQSTSPSISVVSIAATSTSLTVSQAGNVTDTVSISSISGYSGTVQLSCNNLPTFATCTFVPSFFSFPGTSSSASSALTIQTGTGVQTAMLPLLPRRSEKLTGALAAMIWLPGLFTATMVTRRRKIGSLIDRFFLLALLCGVVVSLTACSGQSSGTSSGTGKTPAGAYTVQVVASGPNGLSQTTNLSLTVQ